MARPRFDGTVADFSSLLELCPVVANSTVSTPLINEPSGKIVLFAMDTGQELSDHRAPFLATVHVIEGMLRFGVGSTERDMGPHDWLVMPPEAMHHLRALAPTRFLLTLFKGA